MPKVILEKEDITKLINEAYHGCEIVTELDEKFEIIIRVDNFKPATLPPVHVTTRVPVVPQAKPITSGPQRGHLPVF